MGRLQKSLGGVQQMKVCTRCSTPKDESEFYAKHRKCKKCIIEANALWRQTNLTEARRRDKVMRDKRGSYMSDYAKDPKNKERRHARRNRRQRWQRAHDPQFILREALSRRIRQKLLTCGVEKSDPSSELLGCSLQNARVHLEKLFVDGMSWSNHGEWHIDHIRPLKTFDLTLDSERKLAFNYMNIQPLWAMDNLKKGAKWEG